jgi:hypothetical protein
MRLKHPRIVMACAALAVAGAGAGLAVASAGTEAAAPEVHAVRGTAPDASVLAAFSTFDDQRGPISDGSSQAKLEHLLAPAAADGSPAGLADFDLARAAPIAGSSADAWIAPAGDGVCIYLPDPVDGYGAGCSTVTQIDEGRGFSVLFGDLPEGGVMIAVLVPDGAAPPKVTHGDGSVTTLTVHSNLAAAVLQRTDVVDTGGTTLELSQFVRPTKSRGVSG